MPESHEHAPWSLLLAAVAALALSAGAWAYAAHWRAAQAESELESSIRSALATQEFMLGRVEHQRLLGIARQLVVTYFRGVGGVEAEEHLLARAVYQVVDKELEQHGSQLAGLPVSNIPEADGGNTQRLAKALVTAAGSLGKQPEPPRASGKFGDPEVWEQYHGPALALLELADCLDLQKPMGAIYAMRAWFRLKHPRASDFLGLIVADVVEAEGSEEIGTLRGLCAYIRAGVATMQHKEAEARRLLREAEAAGLVVDAQMEQIALQR